MESAIGIKTDCFAYSKRKDGGRIFQGCKALNALFCKTEECKFYKTKEQACSSCKFRDCKGCPAQEDV